MHPLISKIRCNNPNKTGSAMKNRNLLVYIGTREGVDLTIPELNQAILYSMTSEETDNDDISLSSAKSGVNGLFGNIKTNNIYTLGNELAELTRAGKLIYNGIVSLHEEDALSLGYDKKDAWVNSMRSVLPDIAKEFGIPIEHLNWTAAVHMEPGHPHCHYLFWRNDTKAKSPYIHSSIQDRCRMHLAKEFFAASREASVIEKTFSRDSTLHFAKQELDAISDYLNSNSLPSRFLSSEQTIIQSRMEKLIQELPPTGRIAYKFMPPEVKSMVDNIVNSLCERPDVKRELSKYFDSVNAISESYSANALKREINLAHAKNDINTRLGNCVLATAKTIRKEITKTQQEKQTAEYIRQQEIKIGTAACYSLLKNFLDIIHDNTKQNKMANPFDQRTKKKTKKKEPPTKNR